MLLTVGNTKAGIHFQLEALRNAIGGLQLIADQDNPAYDALASSAQRLVVAVMDGVQALPEPPSGN